VDVASEDGAQRSAVAAVDPDRRDRFEALYRRHAVEILRYAAARLDPAAAQELAADCFLIAWRRLSEIPADHERAWLFAVAARVVANERRSAARRGRLLDRIDERTPGSSRWVVDHAESTVGEQAVRSLLARLSEPDREALQLVEWNGLSAGEAARVVGCSVPAFRVRLHRARRRLLALHRDAESSDELSGGLALPVGGDAT
jgi:RNA polymerase sigma-70 factor (ECF subfamily)